MLILGVRTVSVGTWKTQQRGEPCKTVLSRPAARDFNPYYPLSPFEPILGIGQRGAWTGRDSRLNFHGEPPGRTPVDTLYARSTRCVSVSRETSNVTVFTASDEEPYAFNHV